jgi:hypothetical protein
MENDGDVIHAALFPVQPWLDVPDLGFAVLVAADDAERAGSRRGVATSPGSGAPISRLQPVDEAIRIGSGRRASPW